MVLRHFGAEGIREVLARHIALAARFAGWVDADARFERLAPVPFSVVCFRAAPRDVAPPDHDALNERLLEAVNATGEVFISHTRLRGRFVLRLAIGHLRTAEADVARAWQTVTGELARLRHTSLGRP
jgi:aromatic-L-amino-acid/L-tryptophan decarboxylase